MARAYTTLMTYTIAGFAALSPSNTIIKHWSIIAKNITPSPLARETLGVLYDRKSTRAISSNFRRGGLGYLDIQKRRAAYARSRGEVDVPSNCLAYRGDQVVPIQPLPE
ncbi:hypothetical protein GX51_04693 [Blastomyces parvus]|uniref:Uncharacterized protein n=1 Tax=Blastomyces parvus TaxID=2060905 RepID=A0A2B7X0B4_9EURO|nr:hypothetical protein GX51_04693 [Blastomyces parvus]